MSGFGFYALSSAWLFSLLIPLVIFYFLKLKRPRMDISSLVLWQQVLNDQRVNSPFQRFKRNLLLLLQLSLLILVVLAAMQPFGRGEGARARHLPVLIDNSASMGALDKSGGQTRLALAKKKVNELIDNLLPDQNLCLISFSHTARTRTTGFTNNKRILREALSQIEVEDVPSDIEDALRLAQALSRNVAFYEVMLLSDGNLPSRADFELSFKINYQRLVGAAPNFGITALNARRSSDGDWEVFAQIEGSAEAEGAGAVELFQNDKSTGTEKFSLTKGQSQRLMFRVSGERASSLRLELSSDDFDSLAADNVAYLDLPATRSLLVFCAPTLVAARHALRTLKGIDLFPQEGRTAADAPFDLVITDRVEDAGVAGRVRLTIGLIPDDLQSLLTVEPKGAAVIDWRRNSPLLQHVEMSDLVVLDQPRSLGTAQEGDFEQRGYEVLIQGARGPLLLEKREGEKISYHLLFHTDRSTLPYRVGFPIFISNLVQVALNQAGLAEARANHTGVLPPVTLLPNRAYQVEGPSLAKREEKSDANGVLTGVAAPRVGRYVISENGLAQARVGASLLSPSETVLVSVAEIQFNEKLSVTASLGPRKSDKPLWFALTFAGFCLALAEWWYFQRRPGGSGK